MIKVYKTIIISITAIMLSACITTDSQQQQKDQIIANQVSTMSPTQKKRFCTKIKTNHQRYREKIISIIWKNLSRQTASKITYEQINKNWLALTNQKDSDQKLGKEFSFYKKNMLLNLRYGLVAECPWMSQQSV